jgi:hypothetical protein
VKKRKVDFSFRLLKLIRPRETFGPGLIWKKGGKKGV